MFRSCLEELAALPAGWAGSPARSASKSAGPHLSAHLPLGDPSTMHGCPPGEIEAICLHLLERKGLATLLKLNPTLAGCERVGAILRDGGWGEVMLDEETFRRDLSERTPCACSPACTPGPRGGPVLRGQADQHAGGAQHPRGAAR